MHERMLGFEMTKENPTVEEIPRIIRDGDRPRSEKHRILVVANLDRIDSHPADEPAAHVSDVDFALHLPLEHRRHHAAHSLLADTGVSDAEEAEDDDGQQSHQDDGAANRDAETAGHFLERLSDRESEGELAEECVVHGWLICGSAGRNSGWNFLADRGHLSDRIGNEMSREIVVGTHA